MHWSLSHRADPRALPVVDNHYSRGKVGAPQFMPPGSCFVLGLEAPGQEYYKAVWGTAAPYAQFVRHRWAGAWMCSVFRNESNVCSSELIREAVALTLGHYGTPPALGMVTFVDPRHVAGYYVRAWEYAAYYPATDPAGEGRRVVVTPEDAELLMRIERENKFGVTVNRERFTELRWGYSFWQAGFRFCGWTKGGLYALQLLPGEMPEPLVMPRAQQSLFEAA